MFLQVYLHHWLIYLIFNVSVFLGWWRWWWRWWWRLWCWSRDSSCMAISSTFIENHETWIFMLINYVFLDNVSGWTLKWVWLRQWMIKTMDGRSFSKLLISFLFFFVDKKWKMNKDDVLLLTLKWINSFSQFSLEPSFIVCLCFFFNVGNTIS